MRDVAALAGLCRRRALGEMARASRPAPRRPPGRAPRTPMVMRRTSRTPLLSPVEANVAELRRRTPAADELGASSTRSRGLPLRPGDAEAGDEPVGALGVRPEQASQASEWRRSLIAHQRQSVPCGTAVSLACELASDCLVNLRVARIDGRGSCSFSALGQSVQHARSSRAPGVLARFVEGVGGRVVETQRGAVAEGGVPGVSSEAGPYRLEHRRVEPGIDGILAFAVAMSRRGAGKPRGALQFVVKRRASV